MSDAAYHKMRRETVAPPAGCPFANGFTPFDEGYVRDPYAVLAALREDLLALEFAAPEALLDARLLDGVAALAEGPARAVLGPALPAGVGGWVGFQTNPTERVSHIPWSIQQWQKTSALVP